jgi:hypothetical protein
MQLEYFVKTFGEVYLNHPIAPGRTGYVKIPDENIKLLIDEDVDIFDIQKGFENFVEDKGWTYEFKHFTDEDVDQNTTTHIIEWRLKQDFIVGEY